MRSGFGPIRETAVRGVRARGRQTVGVAADHDRAPALARAAGLVDLGLVLVRRRRRGRARSRSCARRRLRLGEPIVGDALLRLLRRLVELSRATYRGASTRANRASSARSAARVVASARVVARPGASSPRSTRASSLRADSRRRVTSRGASPRREKRGPGIRSNTSSLTPQSATARRRRVPRGSSSSWS